MRVRSSWLLLTGIAATFALAGTSNLLQANHARSALPTRAAEWIWSGDARRERSPQAFWAARDFTLDAVPKSVVLEVQADPEYLLWVNGRRIGGGRFREGEPLDGYEVAPLLSPGTNRLLVQLRSDHGAGGLLLSLSEGENGRQLVVSDPAWTILRRDDPNLLRGFRPLEGGTPAYSWSFPPIGRWGVPRLGGVRSLGLERPAPPLVPAAPSGTPGRAVRFDWGPRSAVGRLALDVVPKETMQVAVLHVEPEGALAGGGASPVISTISVILMPFQREWVDTEVRRFRTVEIVGTLSIEGARALPPRDPQEGVAEPQAPRRGLFGLAPPVLRTPVEDEVGRELERLSHL